ncbi:hypothetical protein [Streptomyces cacaoi]|uniref:hypothetical protein n=1 Tax=Streptomyces cacaoi TaxID=1898 RepID=UPI0026082207|nr:hypothetical protein [Streptomyces cacaoi]
MNHHSLDVRPYTPGIRLDAELAELGYACAYGFADQRPITPALVRSRLTAHGQAPPTQLATCRAPDGTLGAAAALRYPTAAGGTGRLWGPLVHPARRRSGLGGCLLDALGPLVHTVEGRVTTAEVPDDRPAADQFFTACGWQPAPGTAALLKAPLPLPEPELGGQPAGVRGAQGGDLARIETLYAAARPDDPSAAGAGTRWARDARFRTSCLAVADDGSHLLAAALVYPLADTRPGEPAEALLGDLLLHPAARDRPALALHTARWALTAAARTAGATVARAIAPEDERLLDRLGFRKRATIRYYQPGQKATGWHSGEA